MKVVLVESSEKKDFVFLDGTAERAAELLLTVVRFKGKKGVGGAKRTIAQVIETCTVPMIGAGFRDNIHHGPAGASKFSSVGVGRDTKFLHHLIGELIGSSIPAARLCEESIIKVAAVHEKTVLESAQPAIREVTIGGGGET